MDPNLIFFHKLIFHRYWILRRSAVISQAEVTAWPREIGKYYCFLLRPCQLRVGFGFNWPKVVRLKPRNWNKMKNYTWKLKMDSLGLVNNQDWTVCLAHSKGCFLPVAESWLVLSWQQCNEINLVPSTFIIYFRSLRSGD